MKTALILLTASCKSILQSPRALLMYAGMMIVNNGLYLTFWLFLFQHKPMIGDWTLYDVLLLQAALMVGYGIMSSCSRGLCVLDDLLRDGSFDVFMIRPAPPLLQAAFSRTDPSAIGDLAMGLGIMIWLVAIGKLWSISALALLLFMTICFWLATILLSILNFFSSLGSLGRDLFDLNLTLAGYPENFLPKALRFISYTIVPAGLSTYLPLRFAREPSWESFGLLLSGIIAMIVASYLLYAQGIKRYESGSGWS